MDSKTLYKNLLGDLEIEGNDWIEIVGEEMSNQMLMIVRERESLLLHLNEKGIPFMKVTECNDPEMPKALIERSGIFVPADDEDTICVVSEAIKEFYRYM
jgi:hypothetical protein